MAKKLRFVAFGLALSVGLLGLSGPARATTQPVDLHRSITYRPWILLRILFDYMWRDFGRIDDPAVFVATTRHNPWTQTINGVASQLPGGTTTSVSTLVWAGFDMSDHLSLGANQRLAIGGFYRRDWAWTEQAGADQSAHTNGLGFVFGYHFDDWHLSGGAGFDWGGAKITSFPSGNVGNFDTNGHFGALKFGRVFTVWGDRMPADRAAPVGFPFSVRQISVYFDPNFHVGYSRTSADAFTNSGGTPFGKAIERFWTVGGSFTLSAVLPQTDGPIWRPYIEFSVDRQVGYRHTIDLPATSQVAYLNHDKTYWGVNGGLAVWVNPNVSLGASGFYRGSGSQDTGGGLFWVRVNLFGPGGYLRGAFNR